MIAHISRIDGKTQSLENHSRTVEKLCAQRAESLGLKHLAQLVGLLHDMGKANPAFEMYLWSCHRGEMPNKHPHHAATGAIYAHDRWMKPGVPLYENLTAQIVTLCIQGHHAGLADCLSAAGQVDFEEKLENEKARQDVQQAQTWFTQNVSSEKELDELFVQACREVERFCAPMGKKDQLAFERGLLTRLMLSWLVDADRWDAACFEYGQDPLQTNDQAALLWNRLTARFETFRQDYLSSRLGINAIRSDISDQCHAFAAKKPGIYTLSVPTGGGKTFASLRYALSHAMQMEKERIFYIIPYNTILDQNARDIREALGEDAGILEHHANVVMETEDEQTAYHHLTERWDMPIILTSLVQFLNACFSGKNTDARRFHRLTNAVLIFDEIQSLPKHCKKLFEGAISFLTRCCGATVLLCTATQPHLDTEPAAQEIMPDVAGLYNAFSRVRYLPDISRLRTNVEAAFDLADLLQKQSVLAIVNTKAAAWDIAQRVTALLQERGMHTMDGMSEQLPPEENAVLCVHLSTNLCPAHRLHLLDQVKQWNRQGGRVFCISTALIEAGINISFPVVVRSLAGLPSIVQAAGRCNRHMEMTCGDVHIWALADEKLKYLPDVSNGGTCSRQVIDIMGKDMLGDPAAIESYFQNEAAYTAKKQNYPISRENDHGYDEYRGMTLADLLSRNTKCASYYKGFHSALPTWRMVMCQSFRTAGNIFEVIPKDTRAVIVPYQQGRELIAALNDGHTMQEEVALLRKAQMYSVNLYPHVFKRLCEQGAIVPVGETGALALLEGYYSLQGGVQMEREEMELLAF